MKLHKLKYAYSLLTCPYPSFEGIRIYEEGSLRYQRWTFWTELRHRLNVCYSVLRARLS
jgi:hypothetical protein